MRDPRVAFLLPDLVGPGFAQQTVGMEKGTLLHLVEYLEQGGVERLLEQLTARQSTVRRVVIYAYETPEPAGIGKTISDRGTPVVFDKKLPGFDLGLLRRLICVVKEEKIKTIHTHDFGPVLYAILIKICRPSVKLVHTQHTLQNLLPNRKYRYFIQATRIFFQRFVAVSNHVKASLEKECIFLRGFIETIPNGVDTELFPTAIASLPRRKLHLLSVSRISEEKNIPFLIEVCGWLKDQGVPIAYTHIGSGPSIQLSELFQSVRKARLGNEISFAGFHSDVRPFLNQADIFLSASLTEGMPVSVLEAMSMGKPCVLSDIAPHRTFTHSLVRLSPTNVSIFGASILDLWNSRARWPENGSSLHAYIETSFSLSHMVERYEGCYA